MPLDQHMDSTLITVTPRSRSGRSVHKDPAGLRMDSFADYLPHAGIVDKLIAAFTREGCTLEAHSRVGITFSMETALAASLFDCAFFTRRIKYIRELERWELLAAKAISPPFCKDIIDAVCVPKTSVELAAITPPSHRPPELDAYHLKVPLDIRQLAGVGKLHDQGIDGSGVNITMIDTGLWAHPYFAASGADFRVVPAVDRLVRTCDERGHGTAMSSVLLAIAPKARLTLVKMASRKYGFPVAAFQTAVAGRPDLINCSWGTIGYEPQLFLEVVNALNLGIHVVFASGNGSDDNPRRLFQSVAHPDTISVGGAWIPPQGGPPVMSDISSRFDSSIFNGRHAPDICGPCGRLPDAHLILFPTQPGSDFDQRNGKTDGTGQFDGWLLSSGTSGAAAWTSGHLGLLLQIDPAIGIQGMKTRLQDCSRAMAGGRYRLLAAKYFS